MAHDFLKGVDVLVLAGAGVDQHSMFGKELVRAHVVRTGKLACFDRFGGCCR